MVDPYTTSPDAAQLRNFPKPCSYVDEVERAIPPLGT